MADKLITVIIPSYNNGKYIEQSIISVLEQSYKNLELIIIDDNSIDETSEVLKKYNNNQRVKIVLRDQTGSIGKARNDAIDLAEGEFLAFLDSDDYWDSEKLSKQISYSDNYDIICSNGFVVNSNNEIIKDQCLSGFSKSQEIQFTDELQENFIITSSVLLKKNIINKESNFPETKGFVAEDYYLWLHLMSKGANCYFINENLVFYRMLDAKFSIDYNYNEIEFLFKSNEYRNDYLSKSKDKDIQLSIRKGETKCFQVIGINFYKLNKKKESLKYLMKHLRNFKYITFSEFSESVKYIIKNILQ